MMKNFWIGWACLALVVVQTGCVNTVDNRSRWGVPFKKDKIVSLYERSTTEVFRSAKEVLSENGTLRREDTINLILEAKVNNRIVYMRVEEHDASVTRITTQVRTKGGGADIDLASELDKQVALKL